MTQRFLFIMVVWVGLSAFYSDGINPVDMLLYDNTPWELKSDEDDLLIQTRWLKNQEDKKTRQLRCFTDMDVSKETFISTMTDSEVTKDWLPRVEQCKIIEGSHANEWYSYMLFDFPWPMSKRDIIIKNTISEKDGDFVIRMEGIEDYYPVKEDIERMKGFYGYWKINSSTKKLEYSIYSAVKSPVPTWVTDPFIEQNLAESIGSLKNILEKRTKSES